MKIAWLAPQRERCGISDYTDVLLPAVQSLSPGAIHSVRFTDGARGSEIKRCVQELAQIKPDLIHIQHEYGLFGGKNPPFDQFSKWMMEIKKDCPNAKLIATAHTVLDPRYRFPMQGGWVSQSLRWMINHSVIGYLQTHWGEGTWGRFSRIIVHSEQQIEGLKPISAVCIPHFVPSVQKTMPQRDGIFTFVVFGFFTPDKGQDVAIRGFLEFYRQHPGTRLVLAGGLRRDKDSSYLDVCKAMIREAKAEKQIQITGYLSPAEVERWMGQADVLIAPFRSTSGSGSLAQAFARGHAIIASSLPLNQEMNTRVPGCLKFFDSESSVSLAQAMKELFEEEPRRNELKQAARRYAERYSVPATAQAHKDLYDAMA